MMANMGHGASRAIPGWTGNLAATGKAISAPPGRYNVSQ